MYSLTEDVGTWESMLGVYEELLDGSTPIIGAAAEGSDDSDAAVATFTPSMMGVLASAVVSYCLFL